MGARTIAAVAFACLWAGHVGRLAASDDGPTDLSRLPANRWVLIHSEDNSGGKVFARVVAAENVGRLYLWGTGGKKPARNVFLRYELESLDPADPVWLPAFPQSVASLWTAERFPPFRIYGQTGPDGLNYDEGPRLKCVGGYHATNRIMWWDFDGVERPSPIHTFNMACWDSRRTRIVYYSDGCTFAVDPATNSWTDLEAKNHPLTCRTVAWASMGYNPNGDEIVLFGGGLATNPAGGAPTWIYDCAANVWRRPRLEIEPPLRCNAAVVYDPASRSMVLFGGYNQAAALNDTWVYDCRQGCWEERRPSIAPPPMAAPAVAVVPGGGKILVCGCDARKVKLHHATSTSAVKETWVYDVADNSWAPVDASLKLQGYRWLTATGSPRHGAVFLVAFGPERRTYAFRYDPAVSAVALPGAPPGTVAWKYPEQKQSLEQAPAPNPIDHAKRLASLPTNRFVDAKPPGMLISKTWSTAVIDTDRSEVIYTGGGHSGYSGNDVARYSIAENRWSLNFPPRFPPFLEGTNAGIFGWSYGMMPFSQHTYLWYGYDPTSKTVVYLARPSLFDGLDVRLGNGPHDAFVYHAKEHGYASWVYDSAGKKMHKPSFGRPFANPWHLSVIGTPHGVYAACSNRLYHGKVEGKTGRVRWKLIDPDYPEPRDEIRYHYEFQPLVYDARRDRLIQLKGDASRVDVYSRPLAPGGEWKQLTIEGTAAIGREAVYVPRHDAVLWLGNEQLFSLDCAAGRMAELEVDLPDGRYGHECAMVYDPEHDVCVALVPSRFSGPMQTLLYRFDPQTAEYHSDP
ncbi:MAG: Kelch repeat-containing protein [Planctomycetota bacterium]